MADAAIAASLADVATMRLRREGAETGAEDLSLKSEAVTVDDKRVEGHADVMVTLDDDDEEKSEEEEAKVETIAPAKDEEKVEAEPSNALALSVSFLEEETEIIAEDARAAAEPVDGARTVDDDESPSAKDQMPSSPTRADDIEAPRSAPGSPPDSARCAPPATTKIKHFIMSVVINQIFRGLCFVPF